VHRRCGLILLLILLAGTARAAGLSSSEPKPWRPSPTGALLRSLAFPGWGQVYNRQPLKAVIIGGIEEGLIYGVYRQHLLFVDSRRLGDDRSADVYKEDRNRLTWILAGTVILSMVDAYVDDQLFDFDTGDDLSKKKLRSGGIQLRFGIIGIAR